jgi:hypothetical protein
MGLMKDMGKLLVCISMAKSKDTNQTTQAVIFQFKSWRSSHWLQSSHVILHQASFETIVVPMVMDGNNMNMFLIIKQVISTKISI